MRAWFIGTGPSLAKVDITLIPRTDVVFACNRIHVCKPEAWAQGWRPDIYLAVDRSRNPWYWDDLRVHLAEGYPVISADNIISDGRQYGFINWWKFPTLRVVYRCEHDNAWNHPEVGWHLPHVCAFGGPIFYFAQMAIAEYGADELYFLGCDLGYKAAEGDALNHCIPGYLPDRSYPPDGKGHELRNESLLMAHKAIYREAAWRGVRCFNATPGGELEVYPRVTWPA